MRSIDPGASPADIAVQCARDDPHPVGCQLVGEVRRSLQDRRARARARRARTPDDRRGSPATGSASRPSRDLVRRDRPRTPSHAGTSSRMTAAMEHPARRSRAGSGRRAAPVRRLRTRRGEGATGGAAGHRGAETDRSEAARRGRPPGPARHRTLDTAVDPRLCGAAAGQRRRTDLSRGTAHRVRRADHVWAWLSHRLSLHLGSWAGGRKARAPSSGRRSGPVDIIARGRPRLPGTAPTGGASPGTGGAPGQHRPSRCAAEHPLGTGHSLNVGEGCGEFRLVRCP